MPASSNGLVAAFARAYTLSEIFPMHHATVRDAIAELVGLPDGAYPLVADVSRFGLAVADERISDPHGHLRELAQSLHGAGVTQFGMPRGLTLYEAEDFLISLRRVAEAGDVSLQATLANGRGTPVELSFNGGPLEAVRPEPSATEAGAGDELDGVHGQPPAQAWSDESVGADQPEAEELPAVASEVFEVQEAEEQAEPENHGIAAVQPAAPDDTEDTSSAIEDAGPVDVAPSDDERRESQLEESGVDGPALEDSTGQDMGIVEEAARSDESTMADVGPVEPRAVKEWVAAGGGLQHGASEPAAESIEVESPEDAESTIDLEVHGEADFDAATKVDFEAGTEIDLDAATKVDFDADTEVALDADPTADFDADSEIAFAAETQVDFEADPQVNIDAEARFDHADEEDASDPEDGSAVEASPVGAGDAEEIGSQKKIADDTESLAGAEDEVRPDAFDKDEHEQIQTFRAALEEGLHNDPVLPVGIAVSDPEPAESWDAQQEMESVPIADLAPDSLPEVVEPVTDDIVVASVPAPDESGSPTESTKRAPRPAPVVPDDVAQIIEDAELYVRSSDVERAAINQSILEAAARLRVMGRPEAVAEAVERLVSGSDPSEPGPNALAHSLCESDVVDALVVRLGASRTLEQREGLLYTFQRLSDVLAPALSRALSQVPARATRRNYMDALFTMEDDAVRAAVPMLEDSRWFIVRNGVDVIGEAGFPDSVGTLAPALSHPDARVRRATVMAMAKLGGEEAGLELLPTLEDPSQDVREAAAMAVGHLQVLRALRPLLAMLETEKEDDFQQVVLRSLGQLKDPGAVPQIEKRAAGRLFSKPSKPVRIAAYRALAAIGTPHARQLVLTAVQDRDADVAAVARSLASQLE